MPDAKAAILHELNKPLVVSAISLDAPGPGEVLVRMAAAGVCHSDLHVVKGELAQPLPIVLGHEGAGVVESVGDGVTSVRAGDRVALLWVPGCGHCAYCVAGQEHLCENGDPFARDSRLSLDGRTVHHFLSTAAFADHVVVKERGLVAIPDDVPLESAALVGCAVVTGVGAVLNAAQVQPGSTVAVFGCGGVGLNVVQGAKLARAGRIIAIDRVPGKLPLAKAFGATETLDASDPDLNAVDALRDATGGAGVDYAFEVVGHKDVFKQAYASARKGGKVVVVGLPPADQKLEVRGISLVLQEKAVIGSFYGSMSPREHVPDLMSLYREGKLLLDELVSRRFKLEEINEAFEAMESGEVARGVIAFESADED